MYKIVIILTLLAISPLCHAHTVEGVSGFAAGLSHPTFGGDHLLAMVAVGMLSFQMGGRAIWQIPATFVGTMFLGGIWGIYKLPLISFDTGIAMSVVFLGLLIYIPQTLPKPLAFATVSFFALFHGYAHGLEIPNLVEPALYFAGFLLGTTLLHIAGIAIAKVAGLAPARLQLLRALGLVIVCCGIYYLLNPPTG